MHIDILVTTSEEQPVFHGGHLIISLREYQLVGFPSSVRSLINKQIIKWSKKVDIHMCKSDYKYKEMSPAVS